MPFARARQILKHAHGLSAIKILLSTSISSRPAFRHLSIAALRLLSPGQYVQFDYVLADKGLKGLLRFNHINADTQSALELAIGDCYRLPDLPSPELVIDGGGNTGLFAVAACARWPKANVILCEPVAANVEIIKEVLKINSYLGRVSVRHVALWSETGTRTFYLRDANQGSFDGEVAWTGSIIVPTIRLAELIDAVPRRLCLIKLDIEGAEMEVLRDYFSLGQIHKTIIVMELHRSDISRLALES